MTASGAKVLCFVIFKGVPPFDRVKDLRGQSDIDKFLSRH